MRRILLSLVFIFTLFSCGSPTSSDRVITHPDGPLYVGDRVSFEVIVPATTETQNQTVEVSVEGKEIGNAGFGSYGIGGRQEAVLWWVWDTRGLEPGPYTLTFSIVPDVTSWTETVSLLAADKVPPPEPEAHWTSTTTACCALYYITGTAAERDILQLGRTADEQAADVASRLGSHLSTPVDVILMPRVIGHGGFTWNGVYVSYLDGNYIGNDMAILLHHEFVHYYDTAAGGDYLPSIFQEGLAVYLTGGHFKKEVLGPRAAAIFDLDMYIPLKTLADDFYNQQHDIGYLEAGALIQYLVETYGWGAFNEFYRTIPAPDGKTDSDVIDSSLREHFGISFADLETAYTAYLHTQTVTDDVRTDLRLTIDFFDSVRRYQQALDPSAYFLTAWLPDWKTMQADGIVADLLRHPKGWKNRLVETLLIRSQVELFSGDYKSANGGLKWTNAILDILAP